MKNATKTAQPIVKALEVLSLAQPVIEQANVAIVWKGQDVDIRQTVLDALAALNKLTSDGAE